MYMPSVVMDTIAWNATWLPSDCQEQTSTKMVGIDMEIVPLL